MLPAINYTPSITKKNHTEAANSLFVFAIQPLQVIPVMLYVGVIILFFITQSYHRYYRMLLHNYR